MSATIQVAHCGWRSASARSVDPHRGTGRRGADKKASGCGCCGRPQRVCGIRLQLDSARSVGFRRTADGRVREFSRPWCARTHGGGPWRQRRRRHEGLGICRRCLSRLITAGDAESPREADGDPDDNRENQRPNRRPAWLKRGFPEFDGNLLGSRGRAGNVRQARKREIGMRNRLNHSRERRSLVQGQGLGQLGLERQQELLLGRWSAISTRQPRRSGDRVLFDGTPDCRPLTTD